MQRLLAVLWLALVALAQPAWAAPKFPELTGRVVDEAKLLTPSQVVDLTSKSEALEARSGRQLVVATVPSLDGLTIEDYGYQLGRHWASARKSRRRGDLLVAPNQRKVRVETGYGATTFLTDAMSSIIIRNSILPHFRKTPPDYGAGIVAGADAIIVQMNLPAEEAAKRMQQAETVQRQSRDDSPGFIPVIFWIVVILFVIGSMFRKAGGRRYRSRRGGGIDPLVVLWGLDALTRGSRGGGGSWGGGGGGGGFGGFGGGGGGFGGFSGGGGSFGGGGASGSW